MGVSLSEGGELKVPSAGCRSMWFLAAQGLVSSLGRFGSVVSQP